MDIKGFKDKVLLMSYETKTLISNVDNQEYLKRLTELNKSLSVLSNFVKDDLNINVLKNFVETKHSDAEQRPLDNICKCVLGKLGEIEELLNPEVLDFMRPAINKQGVYTQYIHNEQSLSSLINRLNDFSFINLLSAYEILKHLEGHNKTLIVLGPNGSGKTSLANHLKKTDNHVKVIPASKPIKATGYIPSIYNFTINGYNDELYRGGDLSQELMQKLIIGMCNEHDDIARNYMDTKHKEKESTFEKVKAIFDSFFEVKLDHSGFSNKEMRAFKSNVEPYTFNNMSDGERAAFFYIATVISAPNQSFIVVDEPENHLNPAIYNKIWDRLIDLRKDCQFIFISHTMEFINARTSFELVKISEFTYPDKFRFEFLGDDLANIPTNLIVEIVGSRNPILFCEGSKASYDYKIYETLFGDKYTVVPTGNCVSVERNVIACNEHANRYSIQSAIGIIDSDNKSEDSIKRLIDKHIFVLKCNEIEMLLIDEAVFKAVLKHVYKDPVLFESFKEDLFNKINEKREIIVKRVVKTGIDERLNHTVISDKAFETKDNMKANLKSLFESFDVDEMWENIESKINDILSNRDYESALRFCCLEHNEVLAGICNRYVPEYVSLAIGLLRNDKHLANTIRGKYFQDIVLL